MTTSSSFETVDSVNKKISQTENNTCLLAMSPISWYYVIAAAYPAAQKEVDRILEALINRQRRPVYECYLRTPIYHSAKAACSAGDSPAPRMRLGEMRQRFCSSLVPPKDSIRSNNITENSISDPDIDMLPRTIILYTGGFCLCHICHVVWSFHRKSPSYLFKRVWPNMNNDPDFDEQHL